jgi:Glyoxalase-like domain
MTQTAPVDRQLPVGDEIFLDHVGHFVADREAASRALARAGFAPTPESVQVNPDGKTPTGTGNVTAMLTQGYVEMLFKTADTPLGQELDAAIARYAGVHLAAFAVADAARAYRRLGEAGFPLRPLVEFQRPVETERGPATAAFTVARLERGVMPEGRIQMLTHRTEQAVWQPRWLTHPNGALGLASVVFAVADVDEAAQRFARFTGRPAAHSRSGQTIQLDRGRVELVTAEAFPATLPEISIPRLPFAGAYAVVVKSLAAIESLLQDSGIRSRSVGDCLAAPFPDELGKGAWLFIENSQLSLFA